MMIAARLITLAALLAALPVFAAAQPAKRPAASAAVPGAAAVQQAKKLIFNTSGRADAKALIVANGLLRQAESQNPKWPLPLYYQGVICEMRQDIPGAVAVFDRAYALDPSHPAGITAKLRANLLRPLAARVSDTGGQASLKYGLLLDAGREALKDQNWTLAANYADEAVTLDGARWEAQAVSGLAHMKIGEYEAGLKALSAAMIAEKTPDSIKAVLKPALDICDREIRAAALLVSARQKQDAGEFSGAAEEFVQASLLIPGREIYALEAANAYILAQDLAKAQTIIEPLQNSVEPSVRRRALTLAEQIIRARALSEAVKVSQAKTEEKSKELDGLNNELDALEKESQETEDRVVREAEERAQKLVELKAELKGALARYKDYTGNTLEMDKLLTDYNKPSYNFANGAAEPAKKSALLGAILVVAQAENKRKAESTKRQINELIAKIESLGGTLEYRDGTDD